MAGVAAAQETHWDGVARERRTPDHPAVRAFARPKIDFVWKALETGPLSQVSSPEILEIGAGNGFFSVALDAHFAVTALDFSREMLRTNPVAQARRVRADARRLPFGTSSYDVVFCANLLHHLEDPAATVREMARVARRHVVLVEPNRNNPAMALFGLLAPEELGTLRFGPRYTRRLGRDAGLRLRAFSTQGLVVPNKTPTAAVGWLEALDRPNPLGFYHVAVFDRPDAPHAPAETAR